MNKEELRTIYKSKRKNIENTDILSFEIMNMLMDQFDLTGQIISIFLPIERFKEIDTSILLEKFAAKATFTISISDMKTDTLKHLVYEDEKQIEVNSWGIPEPKYGEPVQEKEIDIILVPLLVFDQKGNRVGYGKGFYDRFLQKCRPDSIKIGLSYFEALNELIETNEDDFPLDYCVTPTKVYEFK